MRRGATPTVESSKDEARKRNPVRNRLDRLGGLAGSAFDFLLAWLAADLQSLFLGGVSGLLAAWLGAAPPVDGEGVAAAGASLEGLLVLPPSDLLPEL